MTSVRHALEMDMVLEHELKAGPIYRLIFIDRVAFHHPTYQLEDQGSPVRAPN